MGGSFTSGKDQDARKGIYAMAAADIFKLQRTSKHRSKDLIVCASFFEIYCGKVHMCPYTAFCVCMCVHVRVSKNYFLTKLTLTHKYKHNTYVHT